MAQQPAPSESQVEAAFLVNFPKYVDWPATAFAATNSPICVAIFGDDDVAAEFNKIIQGGKVIGGRPVKFRRVVSADELPGDCQILFLGGSQRQRIPEILARLQGASVLTVGESDDFLAQGGIINLAQRNKRIRLDVNLTAARQAHLSVSSKLLSVADVVKGKLD